MLNKRNKGHERKTWRGKEGKEGGRVKENEKKDGGDEREK